MKRLYNLLFVMVLLGCLPAAARNTCLDSSSWTWSVSSSSAVTGDDGGAAALHDGSTATYWHSDYSNEASHNCPHWILIDRNSDTSEFAGIAYTPRSGAYNNLITSFRVYVSDTAFTDLSTVTTAALGTPSYSGTWSGQSDYSDRTFKFGKNEKGRYILFVIDNTNSGRSTAVAEFNLVSQFDKTVSDYNSVAIHTKAGAIHHIAMDEGNLTLAENGTALRFENTGIAVEYTVPEIDCLTFEYYDFAENEYYVGDKPSGIDRVEVGEPSFRFIGNTIEVSGIAPGTAVSVYSLSGIKAASAAADSEGNATLSLSGQPAGVYILSGGGLSCKITIKVNL